MTGEVTPKITCTDVTNGSSTVNGVVDVSFTDQPYVYYDSRVLQTHDSPNYTGYNGILSIPMLSHNVHGSYGYVIDSMHQNITKSGANISFGPQSVPALQNRIRYTFSKVSSLRYNLDQLSRLVNGTWIYTIKFNSTPGSGQYMDIASGDTEYRVWYNTGSSTAPSAGGKTLVEVAIGASDSVSTVATKTEAQFAEKTFDLPTAAEFGITPGSNFSLYVKG